MEHPKETIFIDIYNIDNYIKFISRVNNISSESYSDL